MLVSFSLENYKSFADNQKLSLVAGTSSKKYKHFSFESSNSLAPNLLRSSCVYGANGSGKSSLIEAMDFFADFVSNSARESQEGDEIEVIPNLLFKEFSNAPSKFEVIFIHKGALYQYGFSVNKEMVLAEWLFSKTNTSNSRMRNLFQRNYDTKKKIYIWEINHTFIKGEKEVWNKLTRNNSLFLSQAVQLNSQDLKIPFEWIRKHFRVFDSPNFGGGYTSKQCIDENLKNKVQELLKSMDTGIVDIKVTEKKITESDILKHLPETIDKQILKDIDVRKAKFVEVKTFHKSNKGGMVELSLNDESGGTQSIFDLAGPFFNVLDNGYTLVVDELHTSLHPYVFKSLIDLFNNPEINKNNAQLIFTSHETSVMNVLHKDQIWFVEKKDGISSELYSLSEIKSRENTNFQKRYLDGRYGGVPEINELTYE